MEKITSTTLAGILAGLPIGNQFISYDAEYDMVSDKKKLKASGRAHFTNGLKKRTHKSATVCFDYKTKVEKNEGEYSGRGSWHTVCMIDGKATPLSLHKGDVLCEDDTIGVMQRVAVIDSKGNSVIIADNPRAYLRYEDTEYQKTPVEWVDNDGKQIEESEVTPHLPKQSPRTDNTRLQVVGLSNLSNLKINGKSFKIIEDTA